MLGGRMKLFVLIIYAKNEKNLTKESIMRLFVKMGFIKPIPITSFCLKKRNQKPKHSRKHISENRRKYINLYRDIFTTDHYRNISSTNREIIFLLPKKISERQRKRIFLRENCTLIQK